MGSLAERCDDADEFIELKRKAIVFCRTIKGCSVFVDPLMDFVIKLRTQYALLLRKQLAVEVLEILRNEKIEPLSIADDAE